ncbi:hypothetical protein Pr1d_07310 [Bythopirellula goksoeyrii]|uniref:Uncharacterized protein n=1 Tax=Bythopirellula goksoeyrii TaxID=1400387 RepID=A0A5B9Q3C1_9BACT|nr:hypothetical protein Pr1d_07310 [Bythopirellula goksoeyrii]
MLGVLSSRRRKAMVGRPLAHHRLSATAITKINFNLQEVHHGYANRRTTNEEKMLAL